MKRLSVQEKDVENYLYDHPDELRVDRWIERQMQLPSGVADLVGVRRFYIVVVEIKVVEINAEALTQICRYAADIECIFEGIDVGYGVQDIKKAIVSPFGIDRKTMFEANALNIDIHTFDVGLLVKVSGKLHWTGDFMDKYQDRIKTLSQSKTLRDAVREIEITVDKEANSAKQDS